MSKGWTDYGIETHASTKQADRSGPSCKGCWELGNNCKTCWRCLETKPSEAELQLLEDARTTPTGYNAGFKPNDFKQLASIFDHIVQTGRMVKDWTPADKLAKGMEELGELATAMLITTGKMKHKPLSEPLIGEVADLIICAIDVLQACHPDADGRMLEVALVEHLFKKSGKWRDIVLRRRAKQAVEPPYINAGVINRTFD